MTAFAVAFDLPLTLARPRSDVRRSDRCWSCIFPGSAFDFHVGGR